ncbi:MAG: S8 family peptidase [Bacteroidales bacterium]|nr:S8 family peptidase [Bacteroidales bacterium]
MNFRLRTYIVFILFLSFGNGLSAQAGYPVYWVSFTDKDHTPYSLDSPGEFLSQRAIDRRLKQGIDFGESDLPVDPAYLDSLSFLGASIINVSNWFNGAMIEVPDPALIEVITAAEFVLDTPLMIRPGFTYSMKKSASSKLELCSEGDSYPYGTSHNQIAMLDGDALHESGYRGEGMLIAILDAGFLNADSISSLQHVWQSANILAWRDFVKDGVDIFDAHNHGTQVFSIIGGIEENLLYGTAPEAEFVLVRTEDAISEYLIEEYNWVCGAEFADSIGADIINSSLGYALFEDASQDHSYEDMDGATAPISIAAGIAASKGMVVVTSAGNEGGNSWRYITAPADADNILAVGATDPSGIITGFSSRGPSADGRVKPDLCAQGYQTVSQHSGGSFTTCAGTSCSSPVIAGMLACLWQSMPGAGREELLSQVRRKSSRFITPDAEYGYGIPNFVETFALMHESVPDETSGGLAVSLFPNPADDEIFFNLSGLGKETHVTVNIIDMSGRLYYQANFPTLEDRDVLKISDLTFLSSGPYLMRITSGSGTLTQTFFKK